MPKLPTDLFDAAVEQLLPFMGTRGERQAELISVLANEPVDAQIDWQGASREFTVKLVLLLSREQLIEVLGRLPVGEPARSAITALRVRIAAEQSQPAASPAAVSGAQSEPRRPAPEPVDKTPATADGAPKPAFPGGPPPGGRPARRRPIS